MDNLVEWHFRNFDSTNQWFGVYHQNCGMAPWHDGRPRCWDCTIVADPTGGDNSVYLPSSFVVNSTQWFQVIIDGIKVGIDLGLAIASEGEDEDAMYDAIKDSLTLEKDVVDAMLQNNSIDINNIITASKQNMAAAAASIGVTIDDINAIASAMGLSGNFGFLAGGTFDALIHADNPATNDDAGWSVFRAPTASASNDYILNHVFIDQGHFIVYWNSTGAQGLPGPSGFWNTWE